MLSIFRGVRESREKNAERRSHRGYHAHRICLRGPETRGSFTKLYIVEPVPDHLIPEKDARVGMERPRLGITDDEKVDRASGNSLRNEQPDDWPRVGSTAVDW